jgi:amino acid permease
MGVYPSPEHSDIENDAGIVNKANPLARQLQGRHMQMIAIGKKLISYQECRLM